jgi:hypothetical protein
MWCLPSPPAAKISFALGVVESLKGGIIKGGFAAAEGCFIAKVGSIEFEVFVMKISEYESDDGQRFFVAPTCQYVLGTNKPLYAPSIIKCWFRAHEYQHVTAEFVAEETGIHVKNVRCILQRMCAENRLRRWISRKGKTHYYWHDFSDNNVHSIKR